MAYYLRELAGMVHPFITKRILPPAPDSEASATSPQDGAVLHRGADSIPSWSDRGSPGALWAVQQVVRNGSRVLGVFSPEQM